MFKKTILILTVLVMLLLVSSCVYAEKNITDDIVAETSIKDSIMVVSENIDDLEKTNNKTNFVLNYDADINDNSDEINSANILKLQNTSEISADNEIILKSVNIIEKEYDEKCYEFNYNDSLEFKIDFNGQKNTQYKIYVEVLHGYTDWNNGHKVTSDNVGDITFSIHLDPGLYIFEIYGSNNNFVDYYDPSWQGHAANPVPNKYQVEILPFYGSVNYDNMKIKGVQATYGQEKSIDYKWDGFFKGYFKIYKGSKVVEKKYLDNFYDWNMFSYSDECSVSWLPIGIFTAKIEDMNGKVIKQAKIKISKTASKVKISSITAKSGVVKWIKAKVYDKVDNSLHNGGKVKFNINGKNYYAKVKSGIAKIKIKVPSKLKTYTCKATFLGDSTAKSSSKTFKITVKKVTTKKTASKKKKITKFTLTVPTKLNKKITQYYGKYSVQTYKYYKSNGKKDITLKITVYKNGKRFSGFDAKYYVHYKSGGGVWLYTKNAKPKGYSHNYVGYTNVLKADWVKVTVWP